MNEEAAEQDQRSLEGVRVVFVLPSLAMGGAERQAFLLARHLKDIEGASVRLVGLIESGALAELCEQAGIPHEILETKHRARDRIGQVLDLLRFAALFRRHGAQILMPYCMFQDVICALSWRLGGARVCIWNQRDEGRLRLHPWAERLAVRSVRCFVSNSTHGAEFLTTDLGVAPERVHMIPNGIETPRPQSDRGAWRAKLGLTDRAFVACMVANLHRFKDHITLVEAWRRVVDRLRPHGLEAQLLFAGAFGDRHAAVTSRIQELGLESDIRLLGEVRDVAGLLESADLGVFSSVAEGIPNAVLESMATGLAVVATEYPGIREAVGDSGAPWLAHPADAADFAEKVVALALDPALRARLGSENRRRVASEFAPQRMCERMTARIAAEWAGRR